jgi:hypothetical protein
MHKKNKNRLYITLQYRQGPGFHWALMLTPKSENPGRDSRLFHAINTIQPGHPVGPSGKPDWRYETRHVNSLRSHSQIARILVAKLLPSTPLDAWAVRIHEIADAVPIVQEDPKWTCRVWVESVLEALRAEAGPFCTIPQVVNGGQVEDRIKAFGEKAKADVLSGTVSIATASDLPLLDLRER